MSEVENDDGVELVGVELAEENFRRLARIALERNRSPEEVARQFVETAIQRAWFHTFEKTEK